MALKYTIGILVLCTLQYIQCNDDTLVQTQQGQVQGEILNSVLGLPYYSYKGIPYAAPPVGKLRFKAPEDPQPWEGVLKAVAHGSVCPQFNPITGIYTSGSEDCLFLNVYSPNIKPKKLYPVVVFIHGGAYIFGSGDSDLYGPDYLLSNDVVVVTFNYRLGVLGFLSLGTEDVPGNAALKDQVAALKWVKNNIANFGGDPDSVTILGDTAGGASVTLHMMSPMSKGLFHKAIAMSGSPTCDFGLTYKPEEKARVFAEELGIYTDDPTERLEKLQEVSYDLFYPISPYVLAMEGITDVLFKMEQFTPVIEKKTGNNFLTEEYYTLLTTGKVNKDVDFIIGYASQEAILLIDLYFSSYIDLYARYEELFSPSELLTKCTPDTNLEVAKKVKKFYFGDKKVNTDNIDLFVSYASNASIAYHAQRFINKWSNYGKSSYFFKFSSFSNRNFFGQSGTKYGIKLASHFDFGYYVFHPSSLNWTIDTNSEEYKMVQRIVTAITNFAKTSDPSVDGVKWPQYTSSSKAYLEFGNNGVSVGYRPDEPDNEFWKSIYDFVGGNY